MSVASELATLASNKASIKAAIEAKSPETAPTNDMSQWSTAIASIPEGGGGSNFVANASGLDVSVDGTALSPRQFRENASTVTFSTGIESWFTVEGFMSDGSEFGYYGDSDRTINLGGRSLVIQSYTRTCLLAGTKILLADGSQKPIEEVGYDDELRVWDFERGRPASAKPLWIKRRETSPYAFVNTFSSGRVLRTTGRSATGWGHRGFNVTRESFTYFPASVGDMFALVDGVDELVECRKVKGEFDFYNVITAGHFNLYADGVLTSCSLINYRRFSGRDLRFVEPPTICHPASDFDGISEAYIRGLHLCEQPASSEELKAYVRRLIASAV